MGLIASTARAFARPAVRGQEPDPRFAEIPFGSSGGGMSGLSPTNYLQYAREGYQKNEIVFRAIELRADSAASPPLVGIRTVPERTRRQMRAKLREQGANALEADFYTRPENLTEKVTEHELVSLLNRPNPLTNRFDFWATVIMHRDIAGNAYVWKHRPRPGAKPDSLWILRPDRVTPIPRTAHELESYRYRLGSVTIDVPPEDVIHFKTRHPLDDHRGQPPLMAAAGRVDVDNFMRDFVAAFFDHGGNPGAVLTTELNLTQEQKDDIKNRFSSEFGSRGGWFRLMVLDGAKASYMPMTQALGTRGLVVPELNNITEARILMVFGIPLSIAGAVLGQEGAAYANKKQDWQVLWDVTLTPIYVDLAETLNTDLLPDFGGLDRVAFDLSQVPALQEDENEKANRLRQDMLASGISIEEFRAETGRDPQLTGTFLLPGHVVAVPAEQITDPPAPAISGEAAAALAQLEADRRSRLGPGRPPLEEDEAARALYDRGIRMQQENPRWSHGQIAARLGIGESTWRRYRARFEEN